MPAMIRSDLVVLVLWAVQRLPGTSPSACLFRAVSGDDAVLLRVGALAAAGTRRLGRAGSRRPRGGRPARLRGTGDRPWGTSVVGMPGFEPGASTSRMWRAAKLRYIPFRGGSVPQAGGSAGGDVGAAGTGAEEAAQVGLGLEGGEGEDLVGRLEGGLGRPPARTWSPRTHRDHGGRRRGGRGRPAAARTGASSSRVSSTRAIPRPLGPEQGDHVLDADGPLQQPGHHRRGARRRCRPPRIV